MLDLWQMKKVYFIFLLSTVLNYFIYFLLFEDLPTEKRVHYPFKENRSLAHCLIASILSPIVPCWFIILRNYYIIIIQTQYR